MEEHCKFADEIYEKIMKCKFRNALAICSEVQSSSKLR